MFLLQGKKLLLERLKDVLLFFFRTTEFLNWIELDVPQVGLRMSELFQGNSSLYLLVRW